MTLNPVTHVFSFDVAILAHVSERLIQLFNASDSIVYITFRKDLTMYQIDAEPIDCIRCKMTGSAESHSAFVYVKRNFITSLPESTLSAWLFSRFQLSHKKVSHLLPSDSYRQEPSLSTTTTSHSTDLNGVSSSKSPINDMATSISPKPASEESTAFHNVINVSSQAAVHQSFQVLDTTRALQQLQKYSPLTIQVDKIMKALVQQYTGEGASQKNEQTSESPLGTLPAWWLTGNTAYDSNNGIKYWRRCLQWLIVNKSFRCIGCNRYTDVLFSVHSQPSILKDLFSSTLSSPSSSLRIVAVNIKNSGLQLP
eukprot:GHVH01012853.1.p1 GENE.GHVH01012853.1~~GHVH01012853.1.p1  ORF type:complete len:311 (+),score=29.07 GHVH01012853.1:188-1120(+)